MMMVLGIALAVGLGIWFGRRLGPALVAVLVVLMAPLWLVGGFIHDIVRKLPAALRCTGMALLQGLGFLVVLPLTPFIFAGAFLADLFQSKHQPPASVHSAAKRTAEVINLASFRQRRRG